MRFKSLFVLPLLLCSTLASAQPDLRTQIEKDIRTLAADRMEGRGLGTKGITLAADYLESRLREIGLQPLFGKSYRQKFPVKTGVSMGKDNRLEGVATADWTPLGFSSSGKFSAPIVFTGYGINAPALGYNDFEGVDLKGKVALMLRYEPQEKDDASPFDGRKPSRWSAMRYKVLKARELGAIAVIYTTGPLQDEGKDKIPPLANDGPESPAGIPVLQVKTSVAQKWLKDAGVDLAQWQNDVDRDLRPRSCSLKVKAIGSVDVKPSYADGENLMGVLRGKGPLQNEIIVLGAHYDHLGYGGEGSMKPNVRAIHPGADDNASGTAGVLSAAATLTNALRDLDNRRTVIFALFSGEERGLAGSGYFVQHTPVAIGSIRAMVNMDMIGNMVDDRVIAFGVDSAPEWRPLVDRLATATTIKFTESGDGYGPSDQTAFYAAKVPVLHFFTGAHDRYHAPEDVADAINFDGEARIVTFVTSLVDDLARGTTSPQYARTSAAPAMQGDSRGYGAYLGTVPDYSAMEATATGGVLISDTRAGSPADKAGLKGGDRILAIGGTKIENLYDMTYALQDHKPGDTVDIVVDRKGEKLTLRATLSSRGGTPAPKASEKPAQQPSEKPAPPPAAQAAPPAAPAATPAAPAMPSMPPMGGMPAAKKSGFFDNRPGKSFVIGAGKPWTKPSEGEKHLVEIRQLTFGGENAEGYFSPDGTKLIYQWTPKPGMCDQQYVLDLKTGERTLVSSGKGRTTCGYYRWPQGDKIVYASTEAGGETCPPAPGHEEGYVWPIYPTYDIWKADTDGKNAKRITTETGYDAEMTWCHRGGKAVFTSMRDGDLDLYEMDEAGNVKRLTNSPGYDGGAFYSADCSEIVWRANHPTGKALDDYKGLLARNLVKPSKMELFVMKSDGTGQRQITENGAANFCPYFFPDGNRIIFTSNVNGGGYEFDLWAINKDGKGLERLTTAEGFDGFPVFSPDGEFLVWASNRANLTSHETNLFIARWVD